jgi:hypothetical protein
LLLASQAVPAKQEARRRTEDSRLRSTSDRSLSVHPAHAFGSHPAQSSAAVTVSGNPQVTLRTTDCSSAGELPRPSRERSGRLRGNPIGGSGTILCEGRGEPRPTLRNSVSASATALRLRFSRHLRRSRRAGSAPRAVSDARILPEPTERRAFTFITPLGFVRAETNKSYAKDLSPCIVKLPYIS